jgi:putative FmdB family regulatory protein
MPLYEYECRTCGHRFEALVFRSTSPACPACRGVDLQRLLSVFAVASRDQASARDMTAGPCGTCGDPRGPGACSIN